MPAARILKRPNFKISERGSSLAWTALILAAVVRSRVNFTASVSIVPDHAHVSMRCSASATVPLTVALGAPVNIRSQAVSAIRFNR